MRLVDDKDDTIAVVIDDDSELSEESDLDVVRDSDDEEEGQEAGGIIKMFIFDNNGYASIYATQHNYFNNHFIGVDKNSGLSFPTIKNISKLFNIKLFSINKPTQVNKIISKLWISNVKT